MIKKTVRKRTTRGGAAAFPGNGISGPVGMTKREHFALQLMWAKSPTFLPDEAASRAVAEADCLIAALNSTEDPSNG